LGIELISEVRDAEEGGYCARVLGYSIFTESETWDVLRANVLEAISAHFENAPVFSRLAQLHYVRTNWSRSTGREIAAQNFNPLKTGARAVRVS
jgi:hypothetical protein